MTSLKEVHGAQRVAAFLLSLDEKDRVTLLSKMRPEIAARVADAMMSLDPRLTEGDTVEALKAELARSLFGPRSVRPCDSDQLRGILEASFGPEGGGRILDEILERRKRERPFVEVERLDPLDVGKALKEESNAVIAVVLSYFDPASTAKILTLLEREVAIDVVRRMAFLEPPNSHVLEAMAANLKQRVESMPRVVGKADPLERLKGVSDVLKESSVEMERGVIESVATRDESAAQELRDFMFTWNDIATIDTRTMQKILGTVDTKTLSIALKGCAPDIEANVLGNLSARVRDMVAEEREISGALPVSEVMSARNDIMKSIRALIEAGEFRPTRGGDELVD